MEPYENRNSLSKSRSGMVWLVVGTALGAAGMFLFDKDKGARRRSFVRDKAFRWRRLSVMTMDKRSRDLYNRVMGSTVEIKNKIQHRGELVDDDILVDRVRSKMGRVVSHPKMIHVQAKNGRVTLSGYALTRELVPLFSKVRSVQGVHSVINNVQPVENERRMSYSASVAGQYRIH